MKPLILLDSAASILLQLRIADNGRCYGLRILRIRDCGQQQMLRAADFEDPGLRHGSGVRAKYAIGPRLAIASYPRSGE